LQKVGEIPVSIGPRHFIITQDEKSPSEIFKSIQEGDRVRWHLPSSTLDDSVKSELVSFNFLCRSSVQVADRKQYILIGTKVAGSSLIEDRRGCGSCKVLIDYRLNFLAEQLVRKNSKQEEFRLTQSSRL
jgi:hypothetical protein